MTISIIIPNWNGSKKIQKHLPLVLNAAKHKRVKEVIVVDDFSTDDSLKILSSFKEIEVIEKESNNGFSSTVNLGVKKASSDLVFLLNNDADIKEETITELLSNFDSEKIFSVGCNAGGYWSQGKFENGFFWHSEANPDNKKIEKAHKTLWVSGGSGLFRKDIWDELGGMDELFNPFYEEDVDLGYRAMKRGYINLWEPKALVNHYREEGVISQNFSKNSISKIAQRNQLIFIWKNITSKKLFLEHKKALTKMLLKNPKYWSIFLSAFTKLSQIKKKRKLEEISAKLTDEEILAMFANSR